MAKIETLGKMQIININKREAAGLIAKLACWLEPVYFEEGRESNRMFPTARLNLEDHGKGETIVFCVDLELPEECGECRALIPIVDGGGQTNRHHRDSCSLFDKDKP